MLLEHAKRVLKTESQAIAELIDRLDDRFVQAVDILYNCHGRVVLTGMGKSGFIAQKIAATFAVTGTPALYLHPAEGVHGDLGMVVRGDVVLAISNSGETEEIIELLPFFKRFGVKLISLVGNGNSTLARQSDVWLDVSVKEEACPIGLTPTASTTAALAMGDALAMVLLEKRGFKRNDFVIFHPGGVLGRRLLLRVRDLMHVGGEVPRIHQDALMKDVILEISGKRLGVTSVVDDDGRLSGIITDGDLRRALEKYSDLLNRRAYECMTRSPKTIDKDELGATAVQIMERYSITSLLIIDEERRPVGIIHLHDLLKAGVV